MPAPERSSPGEVRAALVRLRRGSRALRRQPLHERVQALGRVLERFRSSDSAERRQLERELPEATGFATATVREGLALALAEFSAVALEGLVEREIGTFGKGRLATGFDTTAVMLGGGVPTPTLLALAAPLLLGSPVLARSSAHDPVTATPCRSASASSAMPSAATSTCST